MKKIIFDADLTMGVPDCDVDDGLAILYTFGYLIENPGSLDILGICTSYGNSDIETVYTNAQKVCVDLGLDIPVIKGAPDKDHPDSEAARFLVEQAHAHPGEISLSVTGSTTNLKGALALDPLVLNKFREIVFMGGITQSLVFNGNIMDELNFSCDPEATLASLSSANTGANIVVMTANNCLPAHFMPEEFEKNLTTDAPDGGYLQSTCKSWFETMRRWYGLEGFCCWDVLTSSYILEPQLFSPETSLITLNPTLLRTGFLEKAFEGAPSAAISTPHIRDAEAFCARAYHLWRLTCDLPNQHVCQK